MSQQNFSFAELTRMIEQFKVPGLDMSAVMASRRKDVEAMLEANQVAQAAMRDLVNKQAELLMKTMQAFQAAAGGAAAGPAFAEPGKQAELARTAFQKALEDMTELAEIMRKAQTDASAHISQRAAERMEEIRNMLTPR